MRIAHIVDSVTAVGGVQTYLETVIPALSERGVGNVVLTADAGSPAREYFAGAELVVVPGLEADGRDLGGGTISALRGALDHARPDVVFLHIAASPAVAREATGIARTVAYAHDYLTVCPGNARYLQRSDRFCTEGPGIRCLARAYSERCTNRRPDRLLRGLSRARAWETALPTLTQVLVASPFMAGVMERSGVRPERIGLAPYPVEPPPAVPGAPAERELDVLCIGRLIEAKGVHVLLQAVARLSGVTLGIAGDGPERSRLESLAADLGLSDRVRFHGWISAAERASALATARVVAIPSLWQEPFGIVGLEALAAGVPVVGSDVGGIPSWLTDREAGLLVPAGRADRLAEAIGHILEDSELRGELSQRGPVVAGRYSIGNHLEVLLAALDGRQG